MCVSYLAHMAAQADPMLIHTASKAAYMQRNETAWLTVPSVVQTVVQNPVETLCCVTPSVYPTCLWLEQPL